jgi:DNA-directed RNA polymerase subunit RPC12/RpoP
VNKQLFLTILKSFSITLTVASVLALVMFSLVGTFVPWFLFFILIQFIIFYIVGEIIKRRNIKHNLQVQIKQLEIENQQSLEVTCPCDKNIISKIPIKLDRQNSYRCAECKKDISVYISTKTALQTDPVTVESLNPLDIDMLPSAAKKLINEKR